MEDTDRHHLREQRSFSLHQEIPLPGHVMIYGAKSTFKNGVLDIHLKKVLQEQP
jgi:HSP20 family molecular chaperone IbpA